MTREANSKADQSNTPEQQKKLQDKVEKCKQDVQKVRGIGQGKVVGMTTMPLCPTFIPILPSICSCRSVMTCRQCSREREQGRDLLLLSGQNLFSNRLDFTLRGSYLNLGSPAWQPPNQALSAPTEGL